jgi:hypothetical protein
LSISGIRDEGKNNPIPYPCLAANRFECPHEKGKSSDTKLDVNDLFDLANIAFAVEIALALARIWYWNKD